mmetsp:Transcript_46501/g.61608  ORF Transcript_46501/g.61608 Transcript_46501/m.61608 type:complete len:130 (+) Transcript_46501:1182-1571(+)|eukprot:CAMPEP_0185575496 /NCGR_PEP_ID=MMETSP0434-20130131/6671_1 /TAXON_ID=626734 ORGANISM="Favella taraikaensis, Strain Fe Narragansett Bay" /NCGR_SAMPLE_ID=MMETSP0434 /ASSEMBLY_ACC=CAM_ASM_000379 /LENGTH=129 /DNA_ID=CAMNT_0028192385 /DNA_START=1168 /DNA_END=1557 /DNA_ORIENTATION=+
MSKVPESVDALKKELEAIRKSADTAISIYQTAAADKDKVSYSDFVRSQQKQASDYAFSTPTVPLSLSVDQVAQDRELEERGLLEKHRSKFGYDSELYKKEIQALRQDKQSKLSSKGATFGYRDLTSVAG